MLSPYKDITKLEFKEVIICIEYFEKTNNKAILIYTHNLMIRCFKNNSKNSSGNSATHTYIG